MSTPPDEQSNPTPGRTLSELELGEGGLSDERRMKIAAALQQYRETVLQHNVFLLRIMAETMEAEIFPSVIRQSVARSEQLQEVRRILQGDIPESVKTPRDVLNDDIRAELVTQKCLDGVSHEPVDLNQRKEYFASIRANIPEGVQVGEFPPADLKYLCTLVNSITCPGLPYYRMWKELDFVSPIEASQLKAMVSTVAFPLRDLEHGGFSMLAFIWQDWDIAIGFQIGGADDGGCWALYCYRKEEGIQWKWRYGIQDDDWGSDLYDSVEEFLSFYAHYEEQTEETFRKEIKSVGTTLGVR